VFSSAATRLRENGLRSASCTASGRRFGSVLMAKPNSTSCMIGTPTIIAKVSRSRRIWRNSLSSTATSVPQLMAVAPAKLSCASCISAMKTSSRLAGIGSARSRAAQRRASAALHACSLPAETCSVAPNGATVRMPGAGAAAARLLQAGPGHRPRHQARACRSSRPRCPAPAACRRRCRPVRGSARPRPCSGSTPAPSCRRRPVRGSGPRSRAARTGRRRRSARRAAAVCGSWIRQAASARRCFQPPDSAPASCLRRLARPSRSSVAHRLYCARSGTAYTRATKSRFSSIDRSSYRPNFCVM
jgi:hypothetical protein